MVSPGDDVEPLLEYLKAQRGFDFTGYKRSSLERRIARRMQEIGIGGHDAYIDHLEVHPEEFASLFNTVLINVTDFFRDPDTWKCLAQDVVPALLDGRHPDEPVRVWSAGCSSGEETYSAAMLLADALGPEAYLERVKIYATDVDDEALDHARAGSYGPKEIESVPPEQRERYFQPSGARFVFRKDLRRSIIFGRNDLVQDAPISRIDLLLCRNTLMYFNVETQARILRRFHFALNPDGSLVMGRSEMLITHTDLFKPINLQRRVFGKVATRTAYDRLIAGPGGREPLAAGDGPVDVLSAGAFDTASTAQLVIARNGTLRLVNRAACELLGLSDDDIGRELKDLQVSYRPVELRSHLDRLWRTRRAVEVDDIELASADGGQRKLKLRIVALVDAGDALAGATVAFEDVTEEAGLREQLTHSRNELEASYEELQSTVEELETTNEELQSTNEELETTNEELQSTNEELETMNEELHASNEDLETTNEELRERSDQLDDVNGFLEAILTSLGQAVIVLDGSLCVRIWNQQSTELWGLRPEEAEGEHLLGLDIGLPLEPLKRHLRSALDGAEEPGTLSIEAINRRGQPVTCAVKVLALRTPAGQVNGAILLMEAALTG
jgi:two-component system CheB/CheR fusion protein